MPDVPLAGCTPEPLMSYLKALGILRLVAEHEAGDPRASGCWHSGEFMLRSSFDLEALSRFFLETYRPTPIVGPWAGGSGFFGGDNRKALDAIASSSSPRLDPYRDVIARVREILRAEVQASKPSDEAKARLLRRYRRELPESFVAWMDCALALQGDGQSFPPLLGTGGNDGRLDFTQNFMQRLVDVGIVLEAPDGRSASWLRQALTGEATRGLIPAAVGQFDPGRAGGPNATQGMEGSSLVNPWDYLLMIEGAVVLAGSVTKRLGAIRRGTASFPFTVRAASVGFGTAGGDEESSSRGELWLPLWSRPATLPELRALFTEGRADVSGRPSRDGVDFARAVASLGIDRGIDAFVRYGFLKRSGKAFVAAPLGHFAVPSGGRRPVDLLSELDRWLESFRRACQADDAPPRFVTAHRRIDAAIFAYCQYGGAALMSEVLRALGNAERELANGERFRETAKRTIPPIPPLSEGWLDACDDQTGEFRLARSLAFLRADKGVGPLRTNLEPVQPAGTRWAWDDRGRSVVWSRSDLCTNLIAVLTRRLVDAVPDDSSGRPDAEVSRRRVPRRWLSSPFLADLDDIARFLNGPGEDADTRLEELLWGLILVQIPPGPPSGSPNTKIPTNPREGLLTAYAVLKLLFLAHTLSRPQGDEEVEVVPEAEVLSSLRAGRIAEACEIARRRLWGAGLPPLAYRANDGTRRGPMAEAYDSRSTRRLAAALLFPVSRADAMRLGELVLKPKDDPRQ